MEDTEEGAIIGVVILGKMDGTVAFVCWTMGNVGGV
jgi:hypothetical protein